MRPGRASRGLRPGRASEGVRSERVFMPPAAFPHWRENHGRDEAGTDGEIAEALALLPVGRIGRDNWIERGDDRGVLEILGVELGQARAIEGGAEIEVVAARAFADQADFGEIRSRAAIRAAGHADDDVVGGQPMGGEPLLQHG
jgi:hypothetical protein